jgi:hypothetical protein
VKLASCRIRGRETLTAARGAWTVTFGEDLVVIGDETDWSGITERIAGSGARIREHPRSVQRDRLHLVVQNGRLFQQEHPGVPALVDRGRFLLVELDPARAQRIGSGRVPCFGVSPLEGEGSLVAFEARERPAARAERPAWIQALVDRLSPATFRSDLTGLAELPTRFSTSALYSTASSNARKVLADLGYTARRMDITVHGAASKNVIADRRGSGSEPRDLILVTAHLDSINIAGGPTAPAPGADDNGSGSAGLLQIARVLAEHRPVHDLRLVLFGGEEEGLFGSTQYVAGLSAPERARIRAVLNMDMIGTLNTSQPTVLLEGAALSQAVIDGLADAAAMYTNLGVQTSLHPFNSDHVPFIDAGLPAVLTIEGTDQANTNIHSARDTLDHVDDGLAIEILRMNTAFVAGAIGKQP